MSDTHNHILCAKEVAKTFKNEEIRALTEKYPQQFLLGSQGGDFYAYFDPMSLNGNWSEELAELLHRDINEIMLLFAEYIFSIKDKNERDMLTAYAFGFITHHALDNRTHPFIEGRRGGISHKCYEVKLDVAYASLRNVSLSNIALFPVTREDCAFVSEMNNSVFFAKNKQTVPSDFYYECVVKYFKAMKLTNKAFYLWVAKLLGAIDKRVVCLSDAFYILKGDDDVTKLMNLKCESWRDPANVGVLYDLTYPQLFGYAVADSHKRIELYYEALKRKPTMAVMERIFCGLNF